MDMTKISRELLESLTFRVFTKNDYYGFAGVNSPVPLIAENDAEGIVVIIDGGYCELYADRSDGSFEPIDQVENINELPYKSAKQIAIEAEIKAMETALAKLKAQLN